MSGGCLEGDLAERAREVIAADRPSAVTYDLRDSADELFERQLGKDKPSHLLGRGIGLPIASGHGLESAMDFVAAGENGPVGSPVARQEGVQIAPIPGGGLRRQDVQDLLSIARGILNGLKP